jgi:hypothetical protein
MIRRLLRALFSTTRRPEQNRVANLRAVRQQQDMSMDYGDYEFNRRRAADLRQQAQQKEDG